jgi:hypothetical protein
VLLPLGLEGLVQNPATSTELMRSGRSVLTSPTCPVRPAGREFNHGRHHNWLSPETQLAGTQTRFRYAYDQHPKTYTSLFETVSSDKNWEEYQQVTGFPIGQVKPQGQSIAYAGQYQAYTTRLINQTYALGYIVTMEERMDNLYAKIANGRTKSLAFSMLQAREVNAHLIYNRATTATYTGGDGVVLGSTAHPLQAGGTYANRPVAGSPLSEASIEDAIISIMGFVDDNSLRST